MLVRLDRVGATGGEGRDATRIRLPRRGRPPQRPRRGACPPPGPARIGCSCRVDLVAEARRVVLPWGPPSPPERSRWPHAPTWCHVDLPLRGEPRCAVPTTATPEWCPGRPAPRRGWIARDRDDEQARHMAAASAGSRSPGLACPLRRPQAARPLCVSAPGPGARPASPRAPVPEPAKQRDRPAGYRARAPARGAAVRRRPPSRSRFPAAHLRPPPWARRPEASGT